MVLLLLKVRFVLRVWSLGYEHQYGTVQACCVVRRYQINFDRKELINDLPREICESEIATAEKHGKIVKVTDDKRICSCKWNKSKENKKTKTFCKYFIPGNIFFICAYLRAYQENSTCIVEQRNVAFHRDRLQISLLILTKFK